MRPLDKTGGAHVLLPPRTCAAACSWKPAGEVSGLPRYQDSDWKDQLPPQLTSEGARVDPDWLLRFLRDPSLNNSQTNSEAGRTDNAPGKPTSTTGSAKPANTPPTAAQIEGHLRPQPGADRNGVRTYLKARMPTFSFSPNELQTLVRFFMAVSSQSDIYIKERQEPLSEEERVLARQLFTSKAAPCLKCHITGDAEHDKTATAPNFLLASERLKPSWTFRWLLDPSQISPGTAMPSGLFKRDGERWVFSGETPVSFNTYSRDHADLLVRYMFQMTPDEQRRLMSTSPVETTVKAPPAAAAPGVSSTTAPKISRNRNRQFARRRVLAAHALAIRRKAHGTGGEIIAGRREIKFTRD